MNPAKMPPIDSVQELARFWDTQDLTDFEDELEEVPEPIFELRTELTIPLGPKELEAFRALAKARDTSPVNLVR